MKRIFISYAREDKKVARALAEYLKEKGYRVWWDAHLIIGEEFRKKILAELDQADKVVVIWTKHSVDSSFVIAEAERAKTKAKLIPVQLGVLEPPMGLGDLHTPQTTELESAYDSIIAAIENSTLPILPPKTRRTRKLVAVSAISGACLVALFAGFELIVKPIWTECDLRGLDAQFDYRCYHSRKMRIKFVYPQGALTLDTTKQNMMALPLENRAGRVEVLITRKQLPGHKPIQEAREDERRGLLEKGFRPNHLWPEDGQEWTNSYVITGRKPNNDEFYYKRWFTTGDVVSIEFDYAHEKLDQYHKIIPVMVKERFRFDE